jgi:putative ABC transport system permease protein
MTLGAGQRDVLRMVMGKGLLLTGTGMVIGMAMSVGLAQLLASLIFGVSATDFSTFGGVAIALTTASLLACYIPARRASRVDPMIALRYE